VGRGPGPSPLGRARRGPLAPRLAPPPGRLAPRPARAGADAAASPAPGVPGLAWGGLVLLAAGLPLGGLLHRRRRRAARALAATVAEG
jgi:hypothetical protein